MVKVLLFSFFFMIGPYALEIDEKLTTRFLRVSQTKKTVLINRGLEDGLVKGDHAKFFLTTGVIARGVLVKASPTRSIWSIYRVISAEKIFSDKVVNIKITTPLQTTEDPTKSLKAETLTEGNDILVVRGDDSVSPLNNEDRKDIESLGTIPDAALSTESGLSFNKTIEAWGLLQVSNLSSSTDQDDDGIFTGEVANVDFSLGIEKYFSQNTGFLSRISVLGILHSGKTTSTSIQGQLLSSSVFEYGLGVNYHFIASPLSYNRLIGFAGFAFGVGSVNDNVQFQSETNTTDPQNFDGDNSFVSFGAGFKYYTKSGFGGRVLIDFYRRSESFSFDSDVAGEETEVVTRVVSGPRFLLGMGYRW